MVELGSVRALQHNFDSGWDLGMQAHAPQQLRQQRNRERLGRGREHAELLDRIVTAVGESLGRGEATAATADSASAHRRAVSDLLCRGGSRRVHSPRNRYRNDGRPYVSQVRRVSPRYGKYTIGQRVVRFERATCPQCRAELVRHPDLEDNTWKVHRSGPRPDEELGGSG